MKIEEFITAVANNKHKLLKPAQLSEFVSKTIEVKKYISIKEKKVLVGDIISESVLYEDGIFKFNEIKKYICFTMKTIAKYTNLEMSTDIEDDYDMLCEAGLLNIVIESFSGEYENVKLLLQMQCDYVLSNNNIEIQAGRFLTQCLEQVSEFIGKAGGKLDTFDLNKLATTVSKSIDLSKIMNFFNSQK